MDRIRPHHASAVLLFALIGLVLISLLSKPQEVISQTTGTTYVYTTLTGSGKHYFVDVAVSADGTKIVAVDTTSGGNSGYIYTSTDSGATWVQRTGAGQRTWQRVVSSADGTKLAAIATSASGNGFLYTSSDSGATWTDRSYGRFVNIVSLAMSADGTKLVAAGTLDGYLYTSSDSGASWTARTSLGLGYWTGVTISNDGQKIAATNNSGSKYIHTSTDGGATWVTRTGAGSRSWQGIAGSADGTQLVAGAFAGYLYTSSDSGATWVERTGAGTDTWQDAIVIASDGSKIAAFGYFALWVSNNGGATWTRTYDASVGAAWTGIGGSSDLSAIYLGTNPGHSGTYAGYMFRGVPTTVPTAPTIAATSNASGINLSWTAPANGGSAITGYKVYRDTSSPAVTLLQTISPATSYLDSTALENTTYYYRVKATNAVGDSAYSNEVSAARPCTSTAPSSGNVRGWAWSDTVGWISLSSADQGACTSQSYGLNISQDGTISGKLWSENVGWISADSSDLSGCPQSPCTARMEGNAMKGWMKALGAAQAEAAWDGWISLSGSSPSYGPTITNGVIEGYAWGDTNLGWIAFDTAFSSATTTWVECTPSYQCTSETTYDNLCTTSVVENTACTGGYICGGGAVACVIPPAPQGNGTSGNFRANPQLVAPGRTTNLTWNIQYATSCTVTEDNPNITDTWSQTTGSVTTSPIRIQTKYTLTCTGAGGNLTQTATVYQTPVWKEK